MRPIGILILCGFLSFFTQCKKENDAYLNKSDTHQIIALQPLDQFEIRELEQLASGLAEFFNKRVIILDPIRVPSSFYNPVTGKYSSDSLLQLLVSERKENIVEVIGLTHLPIYCIKYGEGSNAGRPYYDKQLFGIGHQPGNVCIISDERFKTENSETYAIRLRNVTIHETGHNMNLDHCADTSCIMSKSYGNFKQLDRKATAFCMKCLNTVP